MQKAVASSVEIVVAARDLPIGSKIEAGAIKLARWSRNVSPPGALTDPANVIGGVVKERFGENEPVVTDKLFSGQKSGGLLPLLIPAGMRAMSVAVDEVSDVAGFILPGSKVDVLVSVMQTQGNQKPFSKLVLQDVERIGRRSTARQRQGRTATGQGRNRAGHAQRCGTPRHGCQRRRVALGAAQLRRRQNRAHRRQRHRQHHEELRRGANPGRSEPDSARARARRSIRKPKSR